MLLSTPTAVAVFVHCNRADYLYGFPLVWLGLNLQLAQSECGPDMYAAVKQGLTDTRLWRNSPTYPRHPPPGLRTILRIGMARKQSQIRPEAALLIVHRFKLNY